MMEDLLAILSSGEPLTVKELARRLDTSVELVEMMIEDLVKRGILEKVTTDCSGNCQGCSWQGTCILGMGKIGYRLARFKTNGGS